MSDVNDLGSASLAIAPKPMHPKSVRRAPAPTLDTAAFADLLVRELIRRARNDGLEEAAQLAEGAVMPTFAAALRALKRPNAGG